MKPTWLFKEQEIDGKCREAMQGSYFHDSSIEEEGQPLVREAIQNSLDAKIKRSCIANDEPVTVRFYIGTRTGVQTPMSDYFCDEAWKHFSAHFYASNSRKNKGLSQHSPCKYLVYEDFNTKGLVGDVEYSHVPKDDNAYHFFMRAEGRTGKSEDTRGRHGIGKYVFYQLSAISSIIIATVRYDDKKCLITGQSILASHVVDNIKYTPDAWWAVTHPGSRFQLPVENEELFLKMREDFHLRRKEDESGLSVIIPYISDNVTRAMLCRSVINEYALPITKGQLIVEVADDEKTTRFDSYESINNVITDVFESDESLSITPYIDLMMQSSGTDLHELVEIPLPSQPDVPKWDKDYVSVEVAKRVREGLQTKNGIVCVRAWLYVKKQDEETISSSYFDMYIGYDTNEASHKPWFIRGGIKIPGNNPDSVRGYYCVIVIEPDQPLAVLLGDSENPAHTQWEKNEDKFKGKYQWGPRTLTFVKKSFSKLMSLVSEYDNTKEKDYEILRDIFCIKTQESQYQNARTIRNSSQGKNERAVAPTNSEEKHSDQLQEHTSEELESNTDTEPSSPNPKKPYQLEKIEGGFRLVGNGIEDGFSRYYSIRVAYDVAGIARTSALKKYDKKDFDFGSKGRINCKFTSVKEVYREGQELAFETNENKFEVIVTGFDKNRDLVVEDKCRIIVNEAI